MAYPASEKQPPKNLRGYDKVQLKSGQKRTVEFPLVSGRGRSFNGGL